MKNTDIRKSTKTTEGNQNYINLLKLLLQITSPLKSEEKISKY